MARRSGGLGKGLGALIPTESSDAAAGGPGLREVPIASVIPNRFQPRDHFDEEALGALAESIRTLGVLQPILVREVESGYELIRRVRAIPPERGGNVVAVALTAYAAMKDRTRALMEGFTAHAAKPVEPQELVVVIAALLGRRGPR